MASADSVRAAGVHRIASFAEANAFIRDVYLPAHNARFADQREVGGEIDRSHLTQVGRARGHIGAYSPQARGRSERAFQTLQDRLVKELALHRIASIEEANAFVRDVYLPAHNARFASLRPDPARPSRRSRDDGAVFDRERRKMRVRRQISGGAGGLEQSAEDFSVPLARVCHLRSGMPEPALDDAQRIFDRQWPRKDPFAFLRLTIRSAGEARLPHGPMCWTAALITLSASAIS